MQATSMPKRGFTVGMLIMLCLINTKDLAAAAAH
jgi:hypothetical protein